jgi:hypothetical protein
MSWANLLLGALVHVARSDATTNRIFYCFFAHVERAAGRDTLVERAVGRGTHLGLVSRIFDWASGPRTIMSNLEKKQPAVP